MRLGIEVRPEDIHMADPAGAFAFGQDPGAIQDYLSKYVSPGDPVVLSRTEAFVDGEERVFYVVGHDGYSVGVTSSPFGWSMFSALKVGTRRVSWPIRIEGLHVESVCTFAGFTSVSQRAGLGGCGVWLGVGVCGLGRFVYEG